MTFTIHKYFIFIKLNWIKTSLKIQLITRYEKYRNNFNWVKGQYRKNSTINTSINTKEEDVIIDERWSELKITGSNLSGRSYHSLVYDKG